MGLRNFFSNIGGSRIKEITPQDSCKWLEQPRPVTSGGLRFSKRNISNPILSDTASGVKTTVTADDKSSIFKGRSRGISWRRRKSISGLQPEPALDVPDLPVLTRNDAFPPFIDDGKKVEEDAARPGTAITTEGSVPNAVFELSADSISPPSKPEPKPLPPDPPTTRKRSKSAVSERLSKRASWFAPSRRKLSSDLPPLPTSTEPERPKTADGARRRSQQRPISFIPDTIPTLPITSNIRDSLGAASILRSFPSVPSLTAQQDTPPTTTTAEFPSPPLPRDSAIVTSAPQSLRTSSQKPPTLDLHTTSTKPLLTTTKSFSQPLSPALTAPDVWPRPPPNPAPGSETKHSSARSRRRSSTAAAAKTPASRRETPSPEDDGFLSPEQRREYNRVTRFLENMDGGKRGSSGVVRVVSSSGDDWVKEAKFSNQEALAALEFEIGGETR